MFLPAFLTRRPARSEDNNQLQKSPPTSGTPARVALPAAAASTPPSPSPSPSPPPPPVAAAAAAAAAATPAVAAPAVISEQTSHDSVAPTLFSSSSSSPFTSAPPSAPYTITTSKTIFNDDLWIHALSFLSYPEIAQRAQLVSKGWNVMSRTNEIWEPFCAARWAWIVASPPPSSFSAQAAEGSNHPQQQQQQQQRQQHYHTLYTQRAWARYRIRQPPPARPFTDFDLAVNFRAHKSSGTGKTVVLYAGQGHFDDDFPMSLFEFAGWTLRPEVVVQNEELVFPNLSQAMTFFGPQGPCELDFTVIDRQNGRVAELASVVRAGTMWSGATACSLGWDVSSTPQEEELWVIVVPEAVFLEGNLRVLRGVTMGVEREGDGNGGREGGKGAGEAREGEGEGMVRCRVKSAWLCDHQHLNSVVNPGASELGRLEVARMFEQLQWV